MLKRLTYVRRSRSIVSCVRWWVLPIHIRQPILLRTTNVVNNHSKLDTGILWCYMRLQRVVSSVWESFPSIEWFENVISKLNIQCKSSITLHYKYSTSSCAVLRATRTTFFNGCQRLVCCRSYSMWVGTGVFVDSTSSWFAKETLQQNTILVCCVPIHKETLIRSVAKSVDWTKVRVSSVCDNKEAKQNRLR